MVTKIEVWQKVRGGDDQTMSHAFHQLGRILGRVILLHNTFI